MLALVTALTPLNSVGIVMGRILADKAEKSTWDEAFLKPDWGSTARLFARSTGEILKESGQRFEGLGAARYQSLLGRTSQLGIDDTGGESVAGKPRLRWIIKDCLCRGHAPEEFIHTRQNLLLGRGFTFLRCSQA